MENYLKKSICNKNFPKNDSSKALIIDKSVCYEKYV